MKKLLTVLLFSICLAVPALGVNADDIGLEIYENGMTKEEYYQQTIDQYAQFDYSDPNTTTDEELFGKWDGTKWEIEPLLDYERFESLSEIEEAAKIAEGDYSECKRLTLDYYNAKFDTFNLSEASDKYVEDSKYRLTMEMQMDNFFIRPEYGPYPLSKMLVEKGEENAKWHQSTVLDAVKNIVGATEQRVSLHIYALKKDGYTVKFDSKEGENKPFIRVTVNGTTRDYYPVADSYLSGGSNQDTNFGTEQKLLVEESFSSIHEEATTDSYTRRAVLKFDFSDINPTDEITSATLNLYGYMEKSDNPVDSEIEKDSKIVFILNDTSNQSWDEDLVKWEYLDDSGWVGFSYDGTAGYINHSMNEYFPNLMKYRASIMSFQHEVLYFAAYYDGSRDEAVAYHTLRLVMHKIRQLNADFDSTDQPQLNIYRVNELLNMINWLRSSEYMTPEIFTTILKSIYEHSEAMVGAERFSDVRSKIWTSSLKTGNIGAIQTRTLFLMGVVFNEFKAANAPLGELWAEDSYNGGWLEVARNRFDICLENSVHPDGSTTDIPLHYLWTNVNNYVSALCTYPGTYNFDAEEMFGEELVGTIINVAEYSVNMLNPVYGEWQVGDARNYSTELLSNPKKLYNTYPNLVSEHLKYIVSKGKLGSPADYTSFAGDYTNTAVLRSSWEKEAVALNIQASSNFQHTHDDDLGITLMAYGNYLLADPNRYLYVSGDPISVWQQSREAHNSIVIDNKNSTETGGSIHPEDREFNSVYDYLHADSNGYENQLQERYVLFVRPGYYIVTDHIDSSDEASHNYRQNWHFQPGADISKNELGQTKTNYLSNANLTVAPVALENELNSEILDGYYTYESQSALVEDYQYVTYNKDAVGDTSFQTILYPTAKGRNADIQTQVLQSTISAPDARAMRATIAENGKNYISDYYILLNSDAKDEVTYGDYKTDGTMSFTEYTDGEISTIILRNGSYIKDTAADRVIVATSENTEDIGISFEYGKVVVESSKENTNIDGMVVYIGNNNVTTAEYNGQAMTFTKEGKYIYFGNTPVVDIPESDSDGSTDSPENSGNSSNDGASYVPKGDSPSGGMSGSGLLSSKDDDKKNPQEDEDKDKEEENIAKPSDAFSDELEDYWGKTEVSEMVNLKYVNGAEGKLNLQNSITRAEFVTVVMRVLGVDTEAYKGIFKDVSENDWYAPYMEAAYSEGLVQGYENMANPGDYITREQIAKILVKAYENKMGEYFVEEDVFYADSSDASDWANEFISKCSKIRLMNGYVDGTFKPSANITRGEAFVTLHRLLQLINEKQ